mmetsp:Transcript_13453/g.31276  ORF Transcript_13453/g.31276 Transcript_13453/m.31276 type:complete len:215 (-) Transcript_13453:263-907(-)
MVHEEGEVLVKGARIYDITLGIVLVELVFLITKNDCIRERVQSQHMVVLPMDGFVGNGAQVPLVQHSLDCMLDRGRFAIRLPQAGAPQLGHHVLAKNDQFLRKVAKAARVGREMNVMNAVLQRSSQGRRQWWTWQHVLEPRILGTWHQHKPSLLCQPRSRLGHQLRQFVQVPHHRFWVTRRRTKISHQHKQGEGDQILKPIKECRQFFHYIGLV